MGPVPGLDQTDEVSALPLREGRTKPDRFRQTNKQTNNPQGVEAGKEPGHAQRDAAPTAVFLEAPRPKTAAHPSLEASFSVREGGGDCRENTLDKAKQGC